MSDSGSSTGSGSGSCDDPEIPTVVGHYKCWWSDTTEYFFVEQDPNGKEGIDFLVTIMDTPHDPPPLTVTKDFATALPNARCTLPAKTDAAGFPTELTFTEDTAGGNKTIYEVDLEDRKLAVNYAGQDEKGDWVDLQYE